MKFAFDECEFFLASSVVTSLNDSEWFLSETINQYNDCVRISDAVIISTYCLVALKSGTAFYITRRTTLKSGTALTGSVE